MEDYEMTDAQLIDSLNECEQYEAACRLKNYKNKLASARRRITILEKRINRFIL